MFSTHLWKRSMKEPKHIYTVVNIIQPLPFPIKNAPSNTDKNTIPQVDYFATNLSTSSHVDQEVVSNKISYLYERTITYPTDSVIFQGDKLCKGVNFSTDYVKAPSTLIKCLSSSVMSGITTPFLLRNIDQNYYSVRNSTQF